MNEKTWQLWLERLHSLRRDKRGSHERPHETVLLLSIADLLDRQVMLSDELVRTFKRYFEIVRQRDDQPEAHLHLIQDAPRKVVQFMCDDGWSEAAESI